MSYLLEYNEQSGDSYSTCFFLCEICVYFIRVYRNLPLQLPGLKIITIMDHIYVLEISAILDGMLSHVQLKLEINIRAMIIVVNQI